jgi:uncharacterized protein (TIGR02145 family)
MKKKNRIWIFPLIIMGTFLMLTNSCKKDETTSKKDPVITWANPADISFGTLLSTIQLNATADVPGIYVYIPAIGTKLNEGANQDLKIDFTPIDATTYNTASKTVKINVIASTTVIDADSNVYHTVNIGTQTWMVENLKTTKYNDGTTIPNVTDGTAWAVLTTPAYCWYKNDAATNKATYGALYNWYVVNTSKLCPTGWHVPTDAEWSTLTTYLGGESIAGGKLKETGTTHWTSPNTGADNSSGFTALPGGIRIGNGTFDLIRYYGSWWSSSEVNKTRAWHRYVGYTDRFVSRTVNDSCEGLSVRCLRDN